MMHDVQTSGRFADLRLVVVTTVFVMRGGLPEIIGNPGACRLDPEDMMHGVCRLDTRLLYH
jgi:hypothetical protein